METIIMKLMKFDNKSVNKKLNNPIIKERAVL